MNNTGISIKEVSGVGAEGARALSAERLTKSVTSLLKVRQISIIRIPQAVKKMENFCESQWLVPEGRR